MCWSKGTPAPLLTRKIMDYEKMYKEALERAKIEINTKGIGETVNLCEQLFPELAESEDERIRKALVKLLTVASEAYLIHSTGIKKESYLAWLEKQKEQKPVPFSCGHENGAKWSEEDEEIVQTIMSFLDNPSTAKLCPKLREECKDWLKHLPERFNPQPKQDWSEEETPVEKERRRLKGDLKEEVCASDVCAYRGKNVCTVKRDEYCPMFKSKEEGGNG